MSRLPKYYIFTTYKRKTFTTKAAEAAGAAVAHLSHFFYGFPLSGFTLSLSQVIHARTQT